MSSDDVARLSSWIIMFREQVHEKQKKEKHEDHLKLVLPQKILMMCQIRQYKIII